MSQLYVLLSLLVAVVTSGCQTAPTVVTENPERKFDSGALTQPVKVTPETVVVDARPSFDFSTSHIPKSIPLKWDDFTEPEPSQKGILQGDLFAAARRLARAGISPRKQVVVVGSGKSGLGEEGRIAWMLAYLGVSNVQFATLDSLGARLTNAVETGAKSEPMWTPTTDESLNATRDEVVFVINKRGVEQPISYKEKPAALYKIVDVRSEKAYLGRAGLGAKVNIPNMDAINIPWEQFFDTNMAPNREIRDRLASIGFAPDQRIIVLDENGVSSAAVTMALRAFGYQNAGNYSGGLEDLMARGF